MLTSVEIRDRLIELPLKDVYKRQVVEHGIIREGSIGIDHAWDYFSEKDGQIHHFDLCEDCYDEMISGFKLPVETEEQLELL